MDKDAKRKERFKSIHRECLRRQREYRDRMKSFDEMRSLLREIFDHGEFYLGAIEYNEVLGSWSDDLEDRIKSALDKADSIRPTDEGDQQNG